MPTEQEIVTKMKELEHLIGYRFNEINNLKMAMNVEPHPNQYNKKNYCNHALAELGDAVLKTVLSHELFKLDCDRDQITDIKRNLESNESLNRIDR
jgi:dsRNA-specific ribonuclease